MQPTSPTHSPREDTPLLYGEPPRCHGKLTCVARAIVVIYLMYIVVPVSKPQSSPTHPPLPETITVIKPPDNIYSLPLNESCKMEYLDHSPNNLCWKEKGLCLDTYNCPSQALCHFSPQATLAGFLSWHGNGTHAYIAAKKVLICQREIFKSKVDDNMSRQRDLIPGEQLPCGEEGRDYPLSSEGCVVDGSHGIAACKQLDLFVKVIRFTSRFFPLVEAAKTYIDLCWKRLLAVEICHL